MAINTNHQVTAIQQPSRNSCWAASATMIMNWKSGIATPILNVVTAAGPNFIAIYNGSFDRPGQPGSGISPADEKLFYTAVGLMTIQGQSPTPSGWESLLKSKGPLSITVDAIPGQGFMHALVITGLEGGGSVNDTIVKYIDPADGRQHNENFERFLDLYDGAATWPLQIIHNP